MGKNRKRNRKNRKKRNKKMYKSNQNIINNTPVNTGPDYWESDVECISECGKAPDKMVIWIHPLAKEKIEALMEEYTNIEWLAYLIGEMGEKIEVTDLFIPNQEISTAAVDNIVCEEYNNLNTVGVIHSHHSMGNGFSGTDDKYINQNHDISLCISNQGINGHIRWETPCGSYKIVDCIVKVKTESLLNVEEFITSAKEKIKKKTFTTVNYNGHHGYYPGSYVNRLVPKDVITPTNVNNNLENILTKDEIEEMENEIEELDFSKEQTVEEEIDLMNEMEQISTDVDDTESNLVL